MMKKERITMQAPMTIKRMTDTPVFYIEIIETLSRTVTVSAPTVQDALHIARAQYAKEMIILDAADWLETKFVVTDNTA